MLASLLTIAFLVPPDTVIAFGRMTRDLTGDSIPEVLTLVGRGESIDRLDVTFSIESAGRELFTVNFQLRRTEYDGARRISDSAYRAQLTQFGRWFFGPRKFETPEEFLAGLRRAARLHIDLIPNVIARDLEDHDLANATVVWEDMRRAPITIFEFSVGGDAATAIGWSSKNHRFVHLLECC